MDKEVIDKVFGEKVGRMVDEIVPPYDTTGGLYRRY